MPMKSTFRLRTSIENFNGSLCVSQLPLRLCVRQLPMAEHHHRRKRLDATGLTMPGLP